MTSSERPRQTPRPAGPPATFANVASRRPPGSILVGIVALLIVVAIGVVGFHLIEGWTLPESAYMTIISITTVGFSEVHPLSTHGRLLASFVILFGVGTIFYTTTMLGRFIIEGEFRGTVKRRAMNKQIEQLKGHSIICGYGRTGRVVAEELKADGFSFCVIERDRSKEEMLADAGYPYVIGDATEEDVLAQAAIDRAHDVMGLLDSDADNLFLTLNVREMNPQARIITRAENETARRALQRAGAHKVIEPFKLFGNRVLQAAVRPTISEFFELVGDRGHLSLIMEEIQIGPGSLLLGKSLADARIRSEYGVIVIAFRKRDSDMVFNPKASEILGEGDRFAVIGEEQDLRRLVADCNPGS